MCVDDVKEEPVPAAAAHKHLRPLPHPQGELESLFREHRRQILLTAYRVTGSMVDAEDVLQTVFLRLARGTEQYDLSHNPSAYLQRAAVNASLDLLRSHTRSKTLALDDIESSLIESRVMNPEDSHADRELRKLIQQAVARLSPKTAEMFALRYYEGYDNREIAEMLGTSQMVVSVLLHRARTRLRKEIGQYLEKHHEA